jgi:uncharacterized protein YraI
MIHYWPKFLGHQRGFIVKRIVLLGIFLLALSALAPAVWAQDFQATVTADSLRVRATPGLSSAEVGTFALGASVSLSGREDVQGNGGLWVLASDGTTTGWILETYLAYTRNINELPIVAADASAAAPAQPAAPTTDTQTTTTTTSAPSGPGNANVISDANLRGGPGTNFPRVGGVSGNTSATLVARNGDATWVRGNFSGTEGWISASLVRGMDFSTLPVDESTVSGQPAASTTTTTTTTTTGVVPPPVAGGNAASGFSYGAHIAGWNGTELMPGIGMSWIKVQVRYSRGASPDAGWINEAHARGFRVLLGVVGHIDDVQGGEAYFQDYANYVGGLAALGADAIEVWNEPNLDREWPNGMVDPALYTRLLALSYNAIKSNNPNTWVISGAPAPTGFFGGCSAAGCDDAPFLAGMKAAGAASYMDCVGAHYNEGVVAPTATSGDPRSEFYTRYLTGMINTYGNTMGKPICFTELGYLTAEGYGGMPAGFEWGSYNTLAEHASYLAGALNVSQNSGRVRMVIVWNLNFFTPAGTADPAGGYSMIRPDNSCPACDAIRNR